jgi:hypothetical protein
MNNNIKKEDNNRSRIVDLKTGRTRQEAESYEKTLKLLKLANGNKIKKEKEG